MIIGTQGQYENLDFVLLVHFFGSNFYINSPSNFAIGCQHLGTNIAKIKVGQVQCGHAVKNYFSKCVVKTPHLSPLQTCQNVKLISLIHMQESFVKGATYQFYITLKKKKKKNTLMNGIFQFCEINVVNKKHGFL